MLLSSLRAVAINHYRIKLYLFFHSVALLVPILLVGEAHCVCTFELRFVRVV